jgi:two-component system LytT family response regulator
MEISCIIVEDEPLAQERLKAYILKLPYLKLLTVFDNTIDALVFLKSNRTDLVFLDINAGELSGIQMLEKSDIRTEVIITTAYHEYALKGFDLDVTDYLLKPYTFDRFLRAVEKAKNNLSIKVNAKLADIIFIKTGNRLEKVSLSDVLYIEGMRDYRRIYTNDKRIMTLKTFKDLESEIPSNIICRVHKSFMVAIDKIELVENGRIKIKDKLIPVSETYRQQFFELIDPSP